MKNKVLLFWLALMFLFAGGMIVWLWYGRTDAASAKSEPVLPTSRVPLEQFTLLERSGENFSSTSLDGQVWVVSFFFTACPYECLQQNLKIKDLVDEFGSRGVTTVSITCDPERDTSLILAEYADRLQAHDEHWLFLTGKLSYIQNIGEDVFQVSVTPSTHTKKLIFINREGEVGGYFSWSDPEQMKLLRSELDRLLAELVPQVTTSDEKSAEAS